MKWQQHNFDFLLEYCFQMESFQDNNKFFHPVIISQPGDHVEVVE